MRIIRNNAPTGSGCRAICADKMDHLLEYTPDLPTHAFPKYLRMGTEDDDPKPVR